MGVNDAFLGSAGSEGRTSSEGLKRRSQKWIKSEEFWWNLSNEVVESVRETFNDQFESNFLSYFQVKAQKITTKQNFPQLEEKSRTMKEEINFYFAHINFPCKKRFDFKN